MNKLQSDAKAGDIAKRLHQIISTHDSGLVGSKILEAVRESGSVSAETMALAILKYRETDFVVDLAHMNYAHGLMRVMLDSILAKEQAHAQRTQFWASVVLSLASVVLSAASLVLAIAAFKM